jgi:hypothetical protein
MGVIKYKVSEFWAKKQKISFTKNVLCCLKIGCQLIFARKMQDVKAGRMLS